MPAYSAGKSQRLLAVQHAYFLIRFGWGDSFLGAACRSRRMLALLHARSQRSERRPRRVRRASRWRGAHRAAGGQRTRPRARHPGDDQPDGGGRARCSRAAAPSRPPEPRHASQRRALRGDAGRHAAARHRGRDQDRRPHYRIPRRGVRLKGARRRRDAYACRGQRRAVRPTGPTQASAMTNKKSNKPRLCFIGFGEAGQAIASGLREAGVESIAAWDILFSRDEGARLRQGGEKRAARLASGAADAVANSDIIVPAVPAASSLEAAQSVAPHIAGNPYYLDINSVSPGRKQETARLLDGSARYVDVPILAPIHPKRHRTPLLLAGPHAHAVLPLLVDELEMQGVIASDEEIG